MLTLLHFVDHTNLITSFLIWSAFLSEDIIFIYGWDLKVFDQLKFNGALQAVVVSDVDASLAVTMVPVVPVPHHLL